MRCFADIKDLAALLSDLAADGRFNTRYREFATPGGSQNQLFETRIEIGESVDESWVRRAGQ